MRHTRIGFMCIGMAICFFGLFLAADDCTGGSCSSTSLSAVNPDTGQQECNVCQFLESVSNMMADAQCPSNCTKMTPTQCQQIKDKALQTAQTIKTVGARASADILRLKNTILESNSKIRQAYYDVASARSALDQVESSIDSAQSELSRAIYHVNSTIEYFGIADASGGSGRFLVYTNLQSGVYVTASRNLGVSNRLHFVRTTLHTAQDNLSTNRVDAAKESINIALDLIVETFSYQDAIGTELDMVADNYDAIVSEADVLENEVAAKMNCKACGAGKSDDDDESGGSSGGGSSVDFSPIIAAINGVESSVSYWGNYLAEVFSKLNGDYTQAAQTQPFTSVPSLVEYSGFANNWFKRIEYLLYASAYGSLTEEASEEVPETPEKFDQITNKVNAIVLANSNGVDHVHTIVRTGFDNFKAKFSEMIDSLQHLSPNTRNVPISGSILDIEYDDGSGQSRRVDIVIPEGAFSDSTPAGIVMRLLRIAFRVFWSILVLGLYSLAVFYYVRFLFACVKALFHYVSDSLS